LLNRNRLAYREQEMKSKGFPGSPKISLGLKRNTIETRKQEERIFYNKWKTKREKKAQTRSFISIN